MKTLCASCQRATTIEDDQGNVKVHCGALYDHPWIPQPVVKCSSYRDNQFIHKGELEEIAFILDPNRRTIGFQGTHFVAPGTDEHKKLTGND